MSSLNRAALLEAIEFALNDQWDASHRMVQDYDNEIAAWIHAVLHKIEDDIGNSQYWYRRSGRSFTDVVAPQVELKQIRDEILLGQ